LLEKAVPKVERIVCFVVVLLLVLPSAIVSAVHRATVAEESVEVVERARRVSEELAQRGRAFGAVRIEAGRDLGSTARADFDFVTGECLVRIDAEGAAALYRDAASLRFLVYHELSHCELYRRPGGLFRQAGLGAAQSRLLDDFVLLDALDADEPEDRLNLFPLAHEAYADLRAAALLLEEGAHREVVHRIAAMRAEAGFDRYHATERALLRLLDLPPAALSGARLEKTVRALVGEHLVVAGIGPTFRPTMGFPLAFWQLVESRMGSVHGRLAAGQGQWSAYLGNAFAEGAQLAAYPHLAWAFGRQAGADAYTRREFIDAWVREVYGAAPAPAEAEAADATIARLVDRLGGRPSP
jgi:hypothetical protein